MRLVVRFRSRNAERELDALARDSDSGVVEASLIALAQLGAMSTLRSLSAQQNIPDYTRKYVAHLLEREVRR